VTKTCKTTAMKPNADNASPISDGWKMYYITSVNIRNSDELKMPVHLKGRANNKIERKEHQRQQMKTSLQRLTRTKPE